MAGVNVMWSIWRDLVGNLAVVILFMFVWIEAQRRLEGRSVPVHQLALGAWFGFGAAATMLLAVQVEPGLYVDLRITMVALASFIGGPLAGLLAAFISAAARSLLGGSGTVAGLIAIGLSLFASLVAYWFRRHAQHPERALLALAAASALAALGPVVFIPLGSWGTALGSLMPLALVNAAASFAAAHFILRAERQLHEQHLLRSAIAQAPDFLYVKDLNSRFIAVNAAVAEYNAFADPNAMIGKSDFDLDRHDRARRLFLAEQAMMHGGKQVLDEEERLTDAKGEDRWFVTSKSPVRDKMGNPVGLVGVTRDVTRARQMEKELRSSRDLLSHMLSEMSDGVAMFDADARLSFCNDRYRSFFPLTGYVRVPGTPFRTILEAVVRTGEQVGAAEGDAQGWISEVLQSLRSGGEQQVQLFDGRWLHVRTRISDDGGSMVVVSEVTAIKQAETQLRGLAENLRTLASTDALTGLSNRRSFDQALQLEIARSREDGTPLSLIMLDVDRFKAYNDLYGHPAGDACLQRIGECLAGAVRSPGDLAARYGGEEFALILRDAGEPEALLVAERLREMMAASALPHAGNSSGFVTLSQGLAVLRDGETGESMLGRADAALYAAKTGGRDRVVAWHPNLAAKAQADRRA